MLDEIVNNKLQEVRERKAKLPLSEIKKMVKDKKVETRKFFENLNASKILGKPGLIAEIKFSSPSKGLIRDNKSLEEVTEIYNHNFHVTCISVLTDKKYFNGNDEYIKIVKEISSKPVLRKDFIIDEYQIYESYLLETDCVLLIAKILTKNQLEEYYHLALSMNMDVLVEIYSEKDLEKIDFTPSMIGVNSRNLNTMQISIDHLTEMFGKLPDSSVKIAESGIKTKEDVVKLVKIGYNAFLIGETFMSSDNIEEKINELFSF